MFYSLLYKNRNDAEEKEERGEKRGVNAAVAERWRRRASLARSMEVPAKKVQGRGPLWPATPVGDKDTQGVSPTTYSHCFV